jgi:hypothetical protein
MTSTPRIAGLLAAVALAAAAPLRAQDGLHLELGAAGGVYDCFSCESEWGVEGSLFAGGSVSRALVLGAEAAVGQHGESGGDAAYIHGGLGARVHPAAAPRLQLRAGSGLVIAATGQGGAVSLGILLSAGAGYRIPLSPSLSLTPTITARTAIESAEPLRMVLAGVSLTRP